MSKQISKTYIAVILTTLFLLLSGQAKAAITVNNTSSNGAFDNTGLTSLPAFTHSVSGCTNCVLYVGVSTYNSVGVPTARVLSVTYGGQTLTPVGSQVSPIPTPPSLDVGNSSVEVYRLIAPAAPSGMITVTFSVPVNYAVANAISLNEVNQTTPNGAFNSTAAISDMPTLTTTTTLTGKLVLDFLGTSPGAIFLTNDPSQTVCTDIMDEMTCTRGRRFFSNQFDVGASSRKPATGAATTTSWTLTAARSWALGAIAVTPSALTAATSIVGGQITESRGLPLAGVFVRLQNLETGESFTTVTDANGFYKFSEIETTRLYQINIFAFFYDFAPDNLIFNLTDAPQSFDFTGKLKRRGKHF